MKILGGRGLIAFLILSAVCIAGAAAGAPQSVVTQQYSAGEGEAAIFVVIDGKTAQERRMSRGAAFQAGLYPERDQRMEHQGQVAVRCSAPANCSVLTPARWEGLSAPAILVASEFATTSRDYPFEAQIVFRIGQLPMSEMIPHWAPSLCPEAGVDTPENQERERQYEIVRSCLIEREPEAEAAQTKWLQQHARDN